MKRLISLTLLLSLLTASCTKSTEYGECIGVNDTPVPNTHYSVSKWNVILGIVFLETIIVPVVVLFDDLKCPDRPMGK